MHPQTADYWTIQHFNPRLNPRLNPRIDPTKALYHHFITGSRNLLMENHGCSSCLCIGQFNEKIN